MGRLRSLLVLLLLPAAFAAFSGCAACETGPPVSARGIEGADASAGARGFTLDITITDGPDGPLLEGAGVVVYYGGADVNDWSGPRVEVGPERVVVDAINATGTPESREVLRMMTGADGQVHARVPGNRILGIVAAKDGFTEEWLPAVAAGDSGSSGAFTLPLYRSEVSLEMDGVWGPGGGSTGFVTESQYEWDPHPVPFAASDEGNRAYAARIVELRATLTWANGPTGAGDLGIGIGPPEDGPRYFSDADMNVASGAQTETAILDVATLDEHGILGAPGIQAGAATDSGFVAPFGLPYTLAIEARFDTARAALGQCNFGSGTNDDAGAGASVPGVGVVGVLVVAAAVALGGRRLRAS